MQAEIQKLRKKYAKDNDVNQKPHQLQPLIIETNSPDMNNKNMKQPTTT